MSYCAAAIWAKMLLRSCNFFFFGVVWMGPESQKKVSLLTGGSSCNTSQVVSSISAPTGRRRGPYTRQPGNTASKSSCSRVMNEPSWQTQDWSDMTK